MNALPSVGGVSRGGGLLLLLPLAGLLLQHGASLISTKGHRRWLGRFVLCARGAEAGSPLLIRALRGLAVEGPGREATGTSRRLRAVAASLGPHGRRSGRSCP